MLLSLEGTGQLVPVLIFVMGGLARVIIPYLKTALDDPTADFNWRYMVGQILGVAGGMVPVVFTDEFVNTILAQSAIATFLLGWSMADVGRVVHKFSGLLKVE